jgi:branched-chain amino acid transport system ATP-binding protein
MEATPAARVPRPARSTPAGTTVLLVDQNALAALALSQYAYVIDLGRNGVSGTGHELLADPRVQEAYLGDAVAGPRGE